MICIEQKFEKTSTLWNVIHYKGQYSLVDNKKKSAAYNEGRLYDQNSTMNATN